MIHIFIGTKAQYVKTAPVIKELDKRGMEYNLIDSGQHAALSKDYRAFFGIKTPDRFLTQSDQDIKTIGAMLVWLCSFLRRIIFSPGRIRRELFRNEKGICLIHGDTPTTLISALAAKRAGLKVAHLESGLRSYNIFHPFPEEIIRIVTMHVADYLFAPNEWAYDNLRKMNVRGEKILIGGNTNIDVLRLVTRQPLALPDFLSPKRPFVVFSIHRVETILNRNRLGKIIALVKRLSCQYDVLFCMHPPTKKQLKKFSFLEQLYALPGVHARDLLPYPEFIQAIRQAYFVVTDGGSIQEESYFLNIPCLLMRNRTERIEGLGQNVCISEFDDEKINGFLSDVASYRHSDYKETGLAPSRQIVDIIVKK